MTELATTPDTDLAAIESAEQAAAERKREQLANEPIKVPILAVVQGTTNNPPPDAEPGDFFNVVTGDIYGRSIEFLVSLYYRGRFYAIDTPDGRKSWSAGTDVTAPDFWPEEYAGRVFAEIPEAEETFAQLANSKEIEWGSGPPIQTTFNFTGLVVKPQLEGVPPFPVRVSLKSKSAKAGKKLIAALKPLRTFWDRTVYLSTERVQGKKGPYFIVNFDGFGEPPEPGFRGAAIELDQAANQVGVTAVGDEPDEDGSSGGSRPADGDGSGPDY